MMDPAAAENFVDDALEPTSQKLEEVGQIPQTNQGGPLTIIARQVILPGKEADFEGWIKEVAELQEEFEGFMGNEVIRPVGSGHNEYVSIFRYAKYENLQTWMQSTVRKLWMEKARPFIHEPIKIEFHSTEFWFVLDNTSFTPRREKMVVVTFLVIWFQVHFIPPNLNRIPSLPPLANEAIGTLIITLLTTYVLLPIATKYLLHWWLFPKSATKRAARRNHSLISRKEDI